MALVKATLGETDCQPSSMPPRNVADMASIAWPFMFCLVGAGQPKRPFEHHSLPSMTARLRTTFPLDSNPSPSRTDPFTSAWTSRSVWPAGLRRHAPFASTNCR